MKPLPLFREPHFEHRGPTLEITLLRFDFTELGCCHAVTRLARNPHDALAAALRAPLAEDTEPPGSPTDNARSGPLGCTAQPCFPRRATSAREAGVTLSRPLGGRRSARTNTLRAAPPSHPGRAGGPRAAELGWGARCPAPSPAAHAQ